MATPDTDYKQLPIPDAEKVKEVYQELLGMGFSEVYEELPAAFTLAEFAFHIAQVRKLEEVPELIRPRILESVTFNPELIARASEVKEKFNLKPLAAIDFHRKQAFYSLAKTWKKETGHLSNVKTIIAHPAYRRIVRMGKPIIPLLLEDLIVQRSNWFPALTELTGVNPIPLEHAGYVDKMAQDWLDWGANMGLIEKVDLSAWKQ